MNTNNRICPSWFSFFLYNRIRDLFHNPEKMLSDYIKKGQTVIDIGCGPGYFSIPMAKMVGHNGKVISIDLQDAMLDKLKNNATKMGLINNIKLYKPENNQIIIDTKVDFALAFWMIHEVVDKKNLLTQLASILKPEANFLITEPWLHVNEKDFNNTIDIALSVGFKIISRPKIRLSRTALLACG